MDLPGRFRLGSGIVPLIGLGSLSGAGMPSRKPDRLVSRAADQGAFAGEPQGWPRRDLSLSPAFNAGGDPIAK